MLLSSIHALKVEFCVGCIVYWWRWRRAKVTDHSLPSSLVSDLSLTLTLPKGEKEEEGEEEGDKEGSQCLSSHLPLTAYKKEEKRSVEEATPMRGHEHRTKSRNHSLLKWLMLVKISCQSSPTIHHDPKWIHNHPTRPPQGPHSISSSKHQNTTPKSSCDAKSQKLTPELAKIGIAPPNRARDSCQKLTPQPYTRNSRRQ